MAYTTIDDPSAYFQTALYTGNAGTNNITFDGNSDMQPNLIWIKERGGTGSHIWVDTVRGISSSSTPFIKSNSTGAEVTNNVNAFVTSSNSDGFSLGADSYFTDVNKNSSTYASWNWKAGTSFTNDASATGIGTIDSTGSVNQDAGFSIVEWVATGSNATIKHGLSTAPSMIILKTTSVQKNWVVGHDSIGWGKNLWLNGADTVNTSSTYWNNTTPTSSVFSVGTAGDTNDSGETIIAYCFADVKGFSKMISYTGNASTDGTFVYCGFKPSFILTKATATGEGWQIYDNKRLGFNVTEKVLYPNTSGSESTLPGAVDFLSNGFKWRTGDGGVNSNQLYVGMAFAEAPLVGTNNVPCTAR